MFLEICFWLLFALLVLPFPFKMFGYITGKDDSPQIVKIEESTNALMCAVGLVGFYGYLNNIIFLNAEFWYLWLGIFTLGSIIAIFYSPKLNYAAKVIGKSNMRSFAIFSTLVYLPLIYAVFQYAQSMNKGA